MGCYDQIKHEIVKMELPLLPENAVVSKNGIACRLGESIHSSTRPPMMICVIECVQISASESMKSKMHDLSSNLT